MNPHVFSQPEALKISVFEAKTWQFPPHRHTHYELVYILAGQGEHTINAHHYPYQAGDLFLFNTLDVHYFTIAQPTRFCVVKMSAGFLQAAHAAFEELAPLFQPERFFEQPAWNDTEKHYVAQQLAFCMAEYARQQALYERLIQASLYSVLLLLSRAHTQRQLASASHPAPVPDLAAALVAYVQQHLKTPVRLSTAALARHFHLSAGYLGQYFKRHLGRGLKRFVDESRVHALQQELRYGSKTVSQLAYEYGFTDESHLTKVFKTVAQQTPASYRAAWARR